LDEQDNDFAVDQRAERFIILPVEEAGKFQHGGAGESRGNLSSGEVEQESALTIERDRQGACRTARPPCVLHSNLSGASLHLAQWNLPERGG
jgi:hypothetical protein